MQIDVQEFEADPERFVELVETISEIVITRNGQAVARLVRHSGRDEEKPE